MNLPRSSRGNEALNFCFPLPTRSGQGIIEPSNVAFYYRDCSSRREEAHPRLPSPNYSVGIPMIPVIIIPLTIFHAQNPTKTLKIQTVPQYSLSTARYSLKSFPNQHKTSKIQLKLVQTVPKIWALSGTVWTSLKFKVKKI